MIGDGFAEPIGVRFGKIKYKTFALFTKKRYYRTIEGSLTVFISSIFVTSIFSFLFTSNQLFIAFFILPITITLIEAFSPHTWDRPIFYSGLELGWGQLVFYIIFKISLCGRDYLTMLYLKKHTRQLLSHLQTLF
jgi:hypothetical protein